MRSLDNTIVYLVGFAGTGKLTIARALAALIGATVVDNHWINNPIFGLINSDGVTPLPEAVWTQVAKVRGAVLETIATLAPCPASFIFTHDGWDDEPEDHDIYEAMRSASERRNALFVPVRLLCDPDELARRVVSPERRARFKSIDANAALRVSRTRKVLDPKHPNGLTLSYAGFWVTRRSGGVGCRHFDDLDAVLESDTCDDLGQVICTFKSSPCC